MAPFYVLPPTGGQYNTNNREMLIQSSHSLQLAAQCAKWHASHDCLENGGRIEIQLSLILPTKSKMQKTSLRIVLHIIILFKFV